MSSSTQDIIALHPGAGRHLLIPILQEIQEAEGFLSRESLRTVGDHLGIPAAKVYGVATFYNQFRFTPLGRHHVQVCRGTACHVKGSAAVLDALTHALGIEPGETTRDGLFSLEAVACIGACGLAPVICVDGDFHGNLTADRARRLLEGLQRRAAADGGDDD